ncbi:DUF5667 domain-containing protein [Glycomyces algeriensis]|uniref:DUF5667 domain-containing protein n=1 Tax=Glycomyces algeriensis TaxID=256037 RepID=UPI0022D824DC|nr:DUF5667 domain-containing protein [Glycomyces algeriensis]MDA1367654.1 DUF5667 domain-containing protein [Glycomyces algeriensis]MDR7352995.1 hypothetical protein [Glycomyces algeriensis]
MHTDTAEAFAELVGVTERLGGLGEQLMAASRPSQHWQDATRRRLMAVAAEEGIGVTARARASAAVPDTKRAPVLDDMFPRRPRGGRRLAIVAALLTGTVAVSGVSAASGDALPGETLYGVKRSTERAQLALAGNDLGRAQLYLEFARTRIQEASEVVGDDAAVASALSDATGELRSGTALLGAIAVESGDPAPLDYVDLFTNEHRWVLEDLVAELDGDALTAGEELVSVLEAAAVRSVELRGALDCTESGGASDDLGPIPGSCVKDSMDATAPVEPSGADATENGTVETGGDEASVGTDGESEPAAGEEPAGSAEEPQTDPTTGGASDPATTGEPSSEPADGDVLGELTGILSDLFE